jgi:hypothetical protein
MKTNSKETGKMKTQIEKDGNKKITGNVSLAFRVKPHGDNLFSAEILLLRDDTVAESRYGVATTLGHAIGAADDLMDGWAFNEIEQKPEDFFRNVFL